jgi:hypothetical protein
VDATSDLYALAATCVVLLTNKASHEMRDSASNSWQWQSHASVSPALAQVLNTMLAARPSDRYPSAKAALAALDSKPVNPLPPVPPNPGSLPPVPPPALPPLSLIQVLSNAAFIGTEGGLLGIAIASLLGTTLVGGGVWLAMLAGLGFLQLQRTIEKWDFLIIAGLTLAAVVMFAPLNKILGDGAAMIFVIAIMCGGAVVAIAVLFRLIFKLLSSVM